MAMGADEGMSIGKAVGTPLDLTTSIQDKHGSMGQPVVGGRTRVDADRRADWRARERDGRGGGR
jgi:hypothetical protein